MTDSIIQSARERRDNHYAKYRKHPKELTLQAGCACDLLREISESILGITTNTMYLDRLILQGEKACVKYINDNQMKLYGMVRKIVESGNGQT